MVTELVKCWYPKKVISLCIRIKKFVREQMSLNTFFSLDILNDSMVYFVAYPLTIDKKKGQTIYWLSMQIALHESIIQ